MGSASSKAARGAARQFPTRAPGSAVPPSSAAARAGAGVEAGARPTMPTEDGARDDAVDSDVPSSDFSKRLQQMGIADPSPNYSPSSTASQTIPSNDGPSQPLGPAFPPLRQNNTLSVLEARRTLEQQAEENLEEVGRTGRGRKFIDTRTLIDAMQLRSRGAADADIEERLRLHPGLLDKLGTQSMLSLVSPGGK